MDQVVYGEDLIIPTDPDKHEVSHTSFQSGCILSNNMSCHELGMRGELSHYPDDSKSLSSDLG